MEHAENSASGTKSGHETRDAGHETRDTGQIRDTGRKREKRKEKREKRIVKGIILKTRFEKGEEGGEFFWGGRDMINGGQADFLCFKCILANRLNFGRG